MSHVKILTVIDSSWDHYLNYYFQRIQYDEISFSCQVAINNCFMLQLSPGPDKQWGNEWLEWCNMAGTKWSGSLNATAISTQAFKWVHTEEGCPLHTDQIFWSICTRVSFCPSLCCKIATIIPWTFTYIDLIFIWRKFERKKVWKERGREVWKDRKEGRY